MRDWFYRVTVGLMLLSLIGCAGADTGPEGEPGPGVDIAYAQSDEERVTSPDVTDEQLNALIEGNRTFAFNLYRQLREEKDGNIFYSPYSISVALAMTYAGAAGETEQQMADALHFQLPQDELHPAFNHLDLLLESRAESDEGNENGEGEDDKDFRLHITNALWGQKDYGFLDDFLDTLARNYGAGMRLVDFASAPEAARLRINEWVSEQTEGRIEDLIPSGAIDTLTRLVLTNAIYFNAAWAQPFEEENTEDGTFTLLDGSEVTVPMMHQTTNYGYATSDDVQLVELPYDGGKLSMVILLPDEGSFEAFEADLTAERIDALLSELSYRRVALEMPKFEFESEFGLTDTLREMGMPIAFSSDANFSGMTGDRDLFITDVVHKAFVSVDEEGTEAAAATAVMMGRTSLPEEPVEVSLDRPFLFGIRDRETGALLFFGRMMEPSS